MHSGKSTFDAMNTCAPFSRPPSRSNDYDSRTISASTAASNDDLKPFLRPAAAMKNIVLANASQQYETDEKFGCTYELDGAKGSDNSGASATVNNLLQDFLQDAMSYVVGKAREVDTEQEGNGTLEGSRKNNTLNSREGLNSGKAGPGAAVAPKKAATVGRRSLKYCTTVVPPQQVSIRPTIRKKGEKTRLTDQGGVIKMRRDHASDTSSDRLTHTRQSRPQSTQKNTEVGQEQHSLSCTSTSVDNRRNVRNSKPQSTTNTKRTKAKVADDIPSTGASSEALCDFILGDGAREALENSGCLLRQFIGLNMIKNLQETLVGEDLRPADSALREILVRLAKLFNLTRLSEECKRKIDSWNVKFCCNTGKAPTVADQRQHIPNLLMKSRRYLLWQKSQKQELKKSLIASQLLPEESGVSKTSEENQKTISAKTLLGHWKTHRERATDLGNTYKNFSVPKGGIEARDKMKEAATNPEFLEEVEAPKVLQRLRKLSQVLQATTSQLRSNQEISKEMALSSLSNIMREFDAQIEYATDAMSCTKPLLIPDATSEYNVDLPTIEPAMEDLSQVQESTTNSKDSRIISYNQTHDFFSETTHASHNYSQFNAKLIESLSCCIESVSSKIQKISVGMQQQQQCKREADYLREKTEGRLVQLKAENFRLKECLDKARLEKRKITEELLIRKGPTQIFCRLQQNTLQAPECDCNFKITTSDGMRAVIIKKPSQNSARAIAYSRYSFTKVFTEVETQGDIFSEISEVVETVLQRKNVCIIACGPPRTGKSTILFESENGSRAAKSRVSSSQATQVSSNTQDSLGTGFLPGLAFRSAERFVTSLPEYAAQANAIALLRVSCTSITEKGIFDVLTGYPKMDCLANRAKLKTDFVTGKTKVSRLTKVDIRNLQDIRNVLYKANHYNRAESHKGHLVLQLYIEWIENESEVFSKSHLAFVELAPAGGLGPAVSDRCSECPTVSAQTENAPLSGFHQFNLGRSLVNLKEVLKALALRDQDGLSTQVIVPYGLEPLTKLLQETLEENCKILALICSPSAVEESYYNDVISYLEWAQEIKNPLLEKLQSHEKGSESLAKLKQNIDHMGSILAEKGNHLL